MEQKDREAMGSRDKVLVAAATMLGEDPAASLSVRAVAARAGVSTGSLRFHFPTQRALRDAVLAGMYDLIAPDDPIHDTSLPARDRLVTCLRQVLTAVGVGAQARKAWGAAYQSFIAPEPNADVQAAYAAVEREARRRTESWLSVLAREGALTADDIEQRARFLLTILNGLSVERALPAEESPLSHETVTLYAAVDCVLGAPDSE